MNAKTELYQATVRQCHGIALALTMHDIPGMLRAIDRADTMGPILDPTLWRDKHKAMEEDKKTLEAALPLWQLGQKLQGLLKAKEVDHG